MRLLKQLHLLMMLWYVLLFASMVCSFRAVSSSCIALLLVTAILINKKSTGYWISSQTNNRFAATCCLFYCIRVVDACCTGNLVESLADLQTKTALIFVPLAICCSSYPHAIQKRRLLQTYVWIVSAAMLYCLLTAGYAWYFNHAPTSVFFYHALVSPFRQHAVQVSILLFAAFVYLLEQIKQGRWLFSRPVHGALLLYSMGCLLLLSSRLVISFSAACLAYYAIFFFSSRRKNRLVLVVVIVATMVAMAGVAFTHNRVGDRFHEVLSGKLDIMHQQQFTPATYFNGVQFRLLQWRLVKEILTDQRAWVTGVGSRAQVLLNHKYTSMHMYTGSVASGTQGYIGLNTHNQFLQALLQCGIPGLLAFILMCVAMVRLAVRQQNTELRFMVLLLLAYCFNEAVLETQYGLLLFTFFPLFLYHGNNSNAREMQPVSY